MLDSRIEWVIPPLGHQYTPLSEASKPTPSIPCYTQVNDIKQFLYYQETSKCVRAH